MSTSGRRAPVSSKPSWQPSRSTTSCAPIRPAPPARPATFRRPAGHDESGRPSPEGELVVFRQPVDESGHLVAPAETRIRPFPEAIGPHIGATESFAFENIGDYIGPVCREPEDRDLAWHLPREVFGHG